VPSTEVRLARIRGRALARTHNARTIAALASNPGCARRAIMDAAGVDKQRIAAYTGFPAPFGQSGFALARGNAFEAQVKANGAAELLTLLREHLGLPIPQAHYDDLSEVGGNASLDMRHARTRALLARAATMQGEAGTMFDHPVLRLEVGGRHAFLEPDLIAFRLRGMFHVIEIKSFAVIDGQADGDKVAAAAIQSAVYVLALRDALAQQDIPPETVSHETILICPKDFSSRPMAISLDVRKQLTVLRRQLSRIARIGRARADGAAPGPWRRGPRRSGRGGRAPAPRRTATRRDPRRGGMTTLTSLARAIAVSTGTAQPVCTVRHVHIGPRPLVFIPLALAGEANAPLAAMVGADPAAPTLLLVPEPRDRDQRFQFAADLAAMIMPYIQGHFTKAGAEAGGCEPATCYADAPQFLVPNPAGVAFVRLLGRSTRFRRTEGPYAVAPSVPVLGRWLTFFAERAEHPGSSLLVAITDALAAHWAAGQSALEDASLGALLGWIDPPPGMSGAQAAAAAEDPVRCPPAGPATDPTFDNEVLEQRILAVRTARMTGDGRTYDRARTALAQALATQLEPTWASMWRAVGLLRELPAGDHVRSRWDGDKAAFTWHAQHLRDGGPPQARRDGAVSAARRLANLERVQEMVAAQRAFDDPLVLAEYRMTGEAFAGQVTIAEPDRVDATGRRRVLRPRITVATQAELVVQPGTELTSPARPSQKARVIDVAPTGDQTQVVLELQGGMGRSLTPEPGSVPSVGELICYAIFSDSYRPAPAFPEPEDTPWTHGGPPPPYVPSDEHAREDWS
jgi:hypothetical protein